ncbi:hypothetical protein PSPO01_13563 [Paraphaeosphaeria sporulosa]
MSLPTSPAPQNARATQEDTTTNSSATDCGIWNMASRLDKTKGILRVDSDGRIIEEDTGDIVNLDVPDDEAQQYYSEVDPYATSRRFAIPEMKNGATALDDPRARKPMLRVVKNWLTGSSKPPVQEPQWAFSTALRGWTPMNPGRKPGKIMFGNMVDTRRHEGGAKVRGLMVQVLETWYDEEVKRAFGEDWAKQAAEHDKFLVKVEGFVTKLVDDTPKIDEDDEEYDAAVPVDSVPDPLVPEAPKKRGWLW